MFRALFFWLRNGKEAQTLALRAETIASQINALPVPDAEPQRDIVSVLSSTCALLERFSEQQAQQELAQPAIIQPSSQNSTPPPPETTEATSVAPESAKIAPPPETTSAVPELAEPPVLSEAIAASSTKTVLSPTAQDLIKLSDWILLAKTAKTAVKPEVLGEIYRQLIKALAKEGVTLLDETGLCDYSRQAIVGTQVTDDPAQNDHIYSTVRPGYLFREQVIRPQEVIVYISEAPL